MTKLSPERLENLVYQTLESSQLEKVAESLYGNEFTQAEIKELLSKQGVLDKISDDFIHVVLNEQHNTPTIISTNQVDNSTPKLLIKLCIQNGRAFLSQPETPCSIHLEIKCLMQRFTTSKQPYDIDPSFNNSFQLDLSSLDLQSLLETSNPIHLVLIKTDIDGNKSLMATASVEWRQILQMGSAR